DKKNGDLNLEYNLIEKDYNNIYKDFKFENKKLLDINNNIDDKEEQLEVEKGKTIEIHNNISHLKNQLENIKSFDKNIYIRLEKLKKNIDLLKRVGRAHVELQSRFDLVCRLLLEKKKKVNILL